MVKETPYINSCTISVTHVQTGSSLLHLTFKAMDDEIQMSAKPALAGLRGSSISFTYKGFAPQVRPQQKHKGRVTFMEVAENRTLNVAKVGLEVTSPRMCLASQ